MRFGASIGLMHSGFVHGQKLRKSPRVAWANVRITARPAIDGAMLGEVMIGAVSRRTGSCR
jgi:hypothetical protein